MSPNRQAYTRAHEAGPRKKPAPLSCFRLACSVPFLIVVEFERDSGVSGFISGPFLNPTPYSPPSLIVSPGYCGRGSRQAGQRSRRRSSRTSFEASPLDLPDERRELLILSRAMLTGKRVLFSWIARRCSPDQ